MVEIMMENSMKMEFLLDSGVLGPNGFLLRCLKRDSDETDFEHQDLHQIAFFKLFLKYDGAMLTLLAKLLVEKDIERYTFYKSGQWDDCIKQMISSYSKNRNIGIDDNKKLDRLRKFNSSKKYKEMTVRHLFPPRMGLLHDFNLADIQKERGKLTYSKNAHLTKDFCNLFPDFTILDKALDSKSGDFYSRIAELYKMHAQKIDLDSDYDSITEHIKTSYAHAKSKEKEMIPLDAIEDSVCIRLLLGIEPGDLLIEKKKSMTPKICEVMDVRKILAEFLKKNKNFTTMVNRRGIPYYLREKIS